MLKYYESSGFIIITSLSYHKILIDIDYLALDEYDRVGNQAEDSATESMASSKFKVLRRFSTPKQTWDLVG